MKKKKYTHKLTKTGRNSYYVIIPQEILEELNWREHQKLTIKKYGQKVIIADWK